MPKLTYLLINTENMGHATPMAVSGYSGKLYGHAEFDPKHGAHTFRVDAKDYEGDMDLDIAKGMHRRLQRWKIRAALEEEPNSAPESLRDAAVAHVGEIAEIPPFSSVVPPMEQLPPPEWSEIGPGPNCARCGHPAADHPFSAQCSMPPEKWLSAKNQQATPMPDLNIHPMMLEKLVREENEKGANIAIEGERTKVKLRAALADHFAKQAAAA